MYISVKRTLGAVALVAIMGACSKSGVEQAEYDKLMQERDSLAAAQAYTSSELSGLNDYLNSVSECLDSVWTQEGIMVTTKDPETGKRLSRSEIRSRIVAFAQLIDRQRARIAALTDSVNAMGSNAKNVAQLTAMINYLQEQLDAKEAQMNQLKADLANSRKNIEELETNITNLHNENATLASENTALDNMVATQQKKLNEGYFLMGTKKELEQAGILKGGFLKKASLDASGVDLSKCQKVDIRTFTEVLVKAKKPKLLTQAPAGSYAFEDAGKDQKRFVILDTQAFWSLSNVVIIQL